MRIAILSLFLSLFTVMPVFAQSETPSTAPTKVETRKQKVVDKLKDFRENHGRAAVGSCKLEKVDGSILTCTRETKTYTIDASEAGLRRKFGGKASTDELQVGDTLNVIGKFTDTDKTLVKAKLIRDVSIQKRKGAFVGTVKSITGGEFVMGTVSGNRPDQTVTVATSAKLVGKTGKAITVADIKVGDRVMVRGLWDTKANTITEVVAIHDFGQKTVKPSVTIAPTPTP